MGTHTRGSAGASPRETGGVVLLDVRLQAREEADPVRGPVDLRLVLALELRADLVGVDLCSGLRGFLHKGGGCGRHGHLRIGKD